ncbi:MAG: class I tRNA ligase family protein [Phycisphaerae bacterium]
MFKPLPAKFDFPAAEKDVQAFWDRHSVFRQSLQIRSGAPRFVFYEGPPTANGLPHPGHCLTRAMKDLFPRYRTMCGFLVERKAGWDTHGLPVEREVCKELTAELGRPMHTKQDIEAYGVEKFNLRCIQSVFRYTREWEELTRRLGFWVNLDDAYVTFHQQYVESVWWSLKTLFDHKDAQGRPDPLLYQGHKVVWWWCQGGTALSAGEVGEGYRTVDDPSVFVKFPIIGMPSQTGAGPQPKGGAGILPAREEDSAAVEVHPHPSKLGGPGVSPARERTGAASILPAPASQRRDVGAQLEVRRRRLPHWEAGGSTYFVTFRTTGVYKLPDGSVRSSVLSPDERQLALDACLHFDAERMLVHAAVVMPDHVHLLITPLEKSPRSWWPLQELLHSIKSYSANQIADLRRKQNPDWQGWVWLDEYFDRVIRTESDFEEKRAYILGNPLKRGLGQDYAWLWEESAAQTRLAPSKSGWGGHPARPAQEARTTGGQDARPTPSQNASPLPSQAAAPSAAPDHRARVSLLVWTTTPWTLVSNHFAAVHPDLEYALVHDPVDDEHLYIAGALVGTIAKKVKRELRVVSTCKGADLLDMLYVPPFDSYRKRRAELLSPCRELYPDEGFGGGGLQIDEQLQAEIDRALERAARKGRGVSVDLDLSPWKMARPDWRVIKADFVTIDSGTGVVHIAPPFGEADFDSLETQQLRFIDPMPELLCAVNPDGTFNNEAPERYRGRWVKDCDKDIIRELRDERKTPWGTPLLYHQEQYRHDYPFCPQAPDDPLIQYARKSWFVRTSQFREELLKNNAAVNWLPEHIKEGRFGNFLRENVDWALSRERYWGTPLPIWVCESCGRMEAIGAFAELQAKPGATDGGYWERKKQEHRGENFPDHLRVHKPYIDEWTYRCERCEGTGNTEQRTGEAGTEGPRDRGTEGQTVKDSYGRMRRVPEVIDCWWDAGSMPFAQWGFPHVDGSRQLVRDRWPADFISEAQDQTRGWFYGLLAISTLLQHEIRAESRRVGIAHHSRASTTPAAAVGDAHPAGSPAAYPVPYRNVVCLGLIAGEDGEKMSKKLRNYKEPTYIFDAFGADAMRWYFFSAQAPWTSVRFQEAAIRDAQREFLVKLYNVLSFFTIYASIDGFDPRRRDEPGNPMAWRPTGERSELDRWIVTELHQTVRAVRDAMDRFENFPATQRLVEFVDALSNWYVRRSRDRFWRAVDANAECRMQDAERNPPSAADDQTPETRSAFCIQHSAFSSSDQEKWDAYHTLYGCLRTLGRLIAPFTPFFAETMHQHLRMPDDPISVHLCDYPQPDDIRFCDESLAATMDTVRELVALGRSARTAAKLKVRQPISLVEIILARTELTDSIRDHAALIVEELNVKRVDFVSDADKYVSYKVVPNFKAIGAKFRELVPRLKDALGKLTDPAAERRTLIETGSLPIVVDGKPVSLTPEEVEIRLEAKPGWSAAQGRAGVVVIGTEITPELREEGLIRELIHYVQSERKEQDLAYQARITIGIDGPAEFLNIVRRFEPLVASECLASRFEYGPPPTAKDVSVEGAALRLAVIAD